MIMIATPAKMLSLRPSRSPMKEVVTAPRKHPISYCSAVSCSARLAVQHGGYRRWRQSVRLCWRQRWFSD